MNAVGADTASPLWLPAVDQALGRVIAWLFPGLAAVESANARRHPRRSTHPSRDHGQPRLSGWWVLDRGETAATGDPRFHRLEVHEGAMPTFGSLAAPPIKVLSKRQLRRRREHEKSLGQTFTDESAQASAYASARQPMTAFGALGWQPGIRVCQSTRAADRDDDDADDVERVTWPKDRRVRATFRVFPVAAELAYAWMPDDLALCAAVIDGLVWDRPEWPADVLAYQERPARRSATLLAESGWANAWWALAAAGLTGQEAATMIRHEGEQAAITDLAEEMNVSESTVGSILDHAREKVRQAASCTVVDEPRAIGGGSDALKRRPRHKEPQRPMSYVQMLTATLARLACHDGRARRWREGRGLSIAEAADILGVAPGTLSRWERGLAEPSGWHALQLGTLLTLWAEERRRSMGVDT